MGTEKQVHFSLLNTIWKPGSPSTPFPKARDATDCRSGEGREVSGVRIRCFLKRKGTIYCILRRGSQVIWNQNILPVPSWRYLYAH